MLTVGVGTDQVQHPHQEREGSGQWPRPPPQPMYNPPQMPYYHPPMPQYFSGYPSMNPQWWTPPAEPATYATVVARPPSPPKSPQRVVGGPAPTQAVQAIQQPPPRNPSRNPTLCFRCGCPGHVALYCPALYPQKVQPPPQVSPGSTVVTVVSVPPNFNPM